MDLVYAASKIHVITHCETTLVCRHLLPHPAQPSADSIEGITSPRWRPLHVGRRLHRHQPQRRLGGEHHPHHERHPEIKHRYEVPTRPWCCRTSPRRWRRWSRAAGRHAFPVHRRHQKCNEEFGINTAPLDEAFEMVKMGGAPGPNLMYFETGQGLSSPRRPPRRRHADAGSLHLRLRAAVIPFMVNNVTASSARDHFDGKQIIRAA